MSKYVVIYKDEQKDNIALDLRKCHEEYIIDLVSKKIIFMCGTLKGSGKGLLIFEANSLDEAEDYVLKDPIIIQKWYADYDIYEWDCEWKQ